MSHEIYELDHAGYSFQPAWHGLGTTFDRVMTTLEVLDETSVGDYNVIQGTGFICYDPETNEVWDSQETPPPGYILRPTKAMFNLRDDISPADKNAILSELGVSQGYQVFQNSALCEIADTVIGEAGAKYESAGTLRNGKLVWLLARYPEDAEVQGDPIQRYILIYQSHDGSTPIVVAATSVRVVCWNTLSAALSQAGDNRISIRHTVNAEQRVAEAIKAVQKSKEIFETEHKLWTSMARETVDQRFVKAFVEALYPNPKGAKITKHAEKKRAAIVQLAYGEQAGGKRESVFRDGNPTKFGLFNAVGQ